MNSAKMAITWRDYLLMVVLVVGLLSYVRQLSTTCPNPHAGQPSLNDLSGKLREFTRTIEQRLKLDLSSKFAEVEETIQQFQTQHDASAQRANPEPGPAGSGTTIGPKFAHTDNVLTCDQPPRKVTKFSQTWSHKGSYQGCSETEVIEWVANLTKKERKVFSQFGEDGVTEEIFRRIGSGNKFYVEFGVQSGSECLTRNLRENHGWKGVMFDNDHKNAKIGLVQTGVWVDNILDLFYRNKIPRDLDFLSIDTDYGDFWLLEKLLFTGYRPRVFVIETNNNHGPYAALTVPLKNAQEHGHWKGNKFFGTSVNAVQKLANSFGYEYVYLSREAINAFFILRSELSNVNLAQLHWSRQVASTSRMITHKGYGVHPVDTAHTPFSHICASLPCNSTQDY